MESRRRKAWGWGIERSTQVKIDWQLICLDATSGQTLWTHSVTTGPPKHPIHPSNTYATETPVVDERGVYVFVGASGTLAAVGHDGQRLWQQELGAYPTNNGFGTGSSPAIYEGIVFVQHFTSDSSLVAAFKHS